VKNNKDQSRENQMAKTKKEKKKKNQRRIE